MGIDYRYRIPTTGTSPQALVVQACVLFLQTFFPMDVKVRLFDSVGNPIRILTISCQGLIVEIENTHGRFPAVLMKEITPGQYIVSTVDDPNFKNILKGSFGWDLQINVDRLEGKHVSPDRVRAALNDPGSAM